MHAPILRHLELLGFLTSVHRMGDYCELHAVKLPNAEIVHIARADGDRDEDVFLAACELARMCGVELDGFRRSRCGV
jgi:hypothetical protein